MLSSWKRQRKDIEDYPILESDDFYTEWYIQIKHQIKVDGWERITETSFINANARPGSDRDLLELQLVFMSMD